MRTGKCFGVLLAAALLLAATGPMAFAYQVTIASGGGIYSGVAGEFTVYQSGFNVLPYYTAQTSNVNSTNNTFQTFCLEYLEDIKPEVTYDVTFDTKAILGGSPSGSDTLSQGTAWLYSQFAMETLNNYDYSGSNRITDADALQRTIWYLEDERSGLDGSSNKYLTMVQNLFSDPKSDYDPLESGVRVLNLTQGDVLKQSLLVNTPIPAAVWLLGAGVIGLVGVRRRMKS